MSEQAAAPAAAAPEAATETSQGGEEASQESTQPKEAAPKKKVPAFKKFKVGDEEVALSEEDIARDYSKWKAADQKFREAAEARKSVEAFMKALEEDPESVLNDKRLPLNRRKLAEKWLLQQIDEELNPPDPRDAKLTEAEKKLKEYEERERKEAEEKQKQEREALREQRKTAISNTLNEAMKSSQLSAHPESAAAVLREMAMYMRAARVRGEEVTPQELVEHVHNTRFHQMYTLAHQFEGDELIEFLGEEIVNRIRKADLARIREKRQPIATHRDDSWAPSERKPAKRMDAWEAREHAKKLLGG